MAIKNAKAKTKQTNIHIHVPSSRNTLTETTVHQIGDRLRAIQTPFREFQWWVVGSFLTKPLSQ